ncbi:MAG: glycosyl transferase, group 1 [Bacteroidetes bacterium]|jgi:glycosyltransferase involved in cell wall biosynthesis|nr:glycosyl transferase, group 1 [Bacteroidota bacterium]
MSRQLARRGHDVWLACCPGSRLQHEAASEEIRTLAHDVSGYFHPQIAWSLGRFIARQGIDIVHCQLSRDLSTLVPAVRLSFKAPPVILSKRVGSYLSKRDPLHRFTYGGVSRVLAISNVIHRNVLETTPVPPERVITVHDSVDTDLYSPVRADGRSVRREFGIGDDMLVTGFVGRFSPGKGHEELLQAADIVRKQRDNVRFLVVGEASFGERQYELKIRAMAGTMGLEEIVLFAGFRRNIPDIMAAFDLLAFPSHAESFGVVLIEAMAMELPVVSTNCDGVLDIVVNGETGIYVSPRNPSELAAGLLRLIDEPETRHRMGKAGRRRVLEKFDQQKQIDKLVQIYRELLPETNAGERK